MRQKNERSARVHCARLVKIDHNPVSGEKRDFDLLYEIMKPVSAIIFPDSKTLRRNDRRPPL
jgi:hypothetical protein